MSENIQSISQGTYTIGQTSATNFQAGPGIKIDSPSEGTVRIGNDETVLWSGNYTASTTSISLSEPTTNFNTIKVYWQHQTAEKAVFEYVGDSEQWYAIGGRFATPDNVPCIFQSLWSGNYTNYDKKFCNYQFGSLTATQQDANELVPIKVVGIGRKEV